MAKHIDHMEDGIAQVWEDLYDEKENKTYELVYQTCDDIQNVTYKHFFTSSTFSGWWLCCGKPKEFAKIRFPITVRKDNPLSGLTVKILKVPPASEITAQKEGVSPPPRDWEAIATADITFETAYGEGTHIIECDFGRNIVNTDGSYLYIGILAPVVCSMGMFLNTYEDIEYNTWAYYVVSGSQTNSSALSGVATYDFTSKDIYCYPVEFYKKASSDFYSEIGTSKKDKFFELVNDCLNNSDSFGEIFDEKYKSKYAIGSQNFDTTDTNSYAAGTSSTFTGVCFPVGRVPSDLVIGGCTLKIRGRAWNGVSTPITKVYAYLYSVESLPYATGEAYSWDNLSPKLLRQGSVEIDALEPEKATTVKISWNEGNFANVDNKFLMLGYNCDAYNYRCYSSQNITDAEHLSNQDGESYDGFDTWYSIATDANPKWSPHWANAKANAYSLDALEKYYDLGDKFYDMLKEAIANTTIDVDTKPVPTSEVRLAKQYDLVVGDNFQLFYEGVIKAFDPLKEGIAVRCPKGREFPRFWEFKPTADDIGEYTLKMYTRQLDGTIISEGSTKIVVHPKLTESTTPENLKVLCFGDSLTAGGQWCGEGLRRIYGSSSSYTPAVDGSVGSHTVTTYGANKATIQGFQVYHEGYGGWTWQSFLSSGTNSTTNGILVTLAAAHGYEINTVQKSVWTDNNGLLWELEDLPSTTTIKFNRGTGNNANWTSMTLPTSLTCSALDLSITPSKVAWESNNPFYDEATDSISFAAHAAEYGIDKPDVIAGLLTWNGGGGELDFDYESKINTHIKNATTLLRNIHNDFPDAKIVVLGIQISSVTGGTGQNYGANGGYADTIGTAFYAFDYDKALEELLTNSEFGQYCYYVDTKGQFDTYYNMPNTQTAVNSRNSNYKEIRGTNGVHPSTEGYYQIGDAFYRALTKVVPLVTN